MRSGISIDRQAVVNVIPERLASSFHIWSTRIPRLYFTSYYLAALAQRNLGGSACRLDLEKISDPAT